MIKLSKHKKTIDFTPNSLNPKLSTKKFELIYAVKCPKCENIIQAAFYVDTAIDPVGYEETRILHTLHGKDQGSLFYIYPRPEDGRVSLYASTVDIAGKKKVQVIRLKNHVANLENIDKPAKDKMEVGERPCLHVAVISLNKIMAIKELMHATGGCSADYTNHFDFKTHYAKFVNPGWTVIDEIKPETFGPLPVYVHTINKDKYQYSTGFMVMNTWANKFKS